MHIDYTDEQAELRDELRAYFDRLVTDDVAAALEEEYDGGPVHTRLRRRMGADGWLGIGWPTEYGGQGRSELAQYVFYDEASRAGAPVPMIALNTVGPTLMRFGTDEQKERLLPGILAGELVFAIGYTEPEAGTDLASLQTRARREDGRWVVNGSKVFTSHGEFADYIWLAARTDPDASKHEGISILLVDTDQPGFRATPIRTVGGGQVTATYYDDVHVPAENLVGEEHGGWGLITTQLNHERVAMAASGGREIDLWERALEACRRQRREDGTRLVDVPWIRRNLARAHARLEAMKLLNWRMADAVDRDALTAADASTAKVYGTETEVEVYRLLLEVFGELGAVRGGSPGAVLGGDLERGYRHAPVGTFGGGSNEIQRTIIAAAGLGMPRTRR